MPASSIVASSSRPTRARMLALAGLVSLLWSSSWILIRTGLEDADLSPLTFAGLRYGVAALALTLWLTARRRPPEIELLTGRHVGSGHRNRVRVVPWGRLVALGLVQFAVTQGAQFVAIDHQPAATTSLLLATTPLLVALSGGLIGERPTLLHVLAGVTIGAGSAVYFSGELGWTAIGLTAALVGLGGNAGAVLLGRATMRAAAVYATELTRTTMAIGAVTLMAVGLTVDGWPRLTVTGAAIVAWLATVNTAAAFTWWNVCLRHLQAAEVAAINSTMVIQIPLLAWIFLDESLGWAEAAGLGVVAAGVVLASQPRRPALR